jgi:uncharacterized membrane protein
LWTRRCANQKKLNIVLGLVTAAMGVFFAVVASGVISFGPERAQEDPRWVSVLFGVIFLLGGAAVAISGVVGGNEQDHDGLPPAAPRWLRGITRLMALAIVVCFGAVFSWIGFGPGQRSFEGSGAILGPTFGRAMFGSFAGLIWLVLGAMAIARLRRILGRR